MGRLLALVIVITAAFTAASFPSVASPAADATPASSQAWCRGSVSWQTARRRDGRFTRVKATVVSSFYASTSNGRPTFLNLGRDYPSPGRLTVVIRGRNRGNFPRAPERMFRAGTTICVEGVVYTYRGVPNIEATSYNARARLLGE